MRRFAEGTRVPIETTRAELERLVTAFGADGFVAGWEGTTSTVAFRLRGRHIRYSIERPADRDEVVAAYPSGKSRPYHLRSEAIAAEYRRRWRALLLIIRAKLETIASGDSDFDDEFMPHVMLPDGSLVRDWLAPQVEQAYQTGSMPALLPGASRPALPSGDRR